MRKEINEIVREWALKHGGCYQLAWNNVYKEFGKQSRIYVKARARHRKVRPLDIVEQLGLLEILKKVAGRIKASNARRRADRRCWFCMSDLARALRYSKPYDAAQFLCSKENMQKITVPHIQSDTRTMQMWFCNEHGFMEVVRKKVAKPDREKVLERGLDGRDFSEFLVW